MDKFNKKDSIYSSCHRQIGDFIFDKKVVNVFEDMISRSVPGYQSIISMIGVLAKEFVQENSFCYDLGCSLGAATLSMVRSIQKQNVKIFSVDNSAPMVEECRKKIAECSADVPVEVLCLSVQDVDIERASMVVLNFVLT